MRFVVAEQLRSAWYVRSVSAPDVEEPHALTDARALADDRREPGEGDLPGVGAAFLIPITDSLKTFAWVAGPHVIEGKPHRRVLLACARWTGSAPPTQRELDAREVLELFDVKGTSFGPLVLHTHEAVSVAWTRLGNVTRPAVAHGPLWGGGLDTIQFYVRRMWQAKHAPGSLAAELAAERAAEEDPDARAVAQLVAARKKGPLAQLATLDLLPEWDGLTTKRRKTTVAKWLRACVVSLGALPPTAKRGDKLAVIRATVERINAWSGCDEIDTPEREALCTAIDDIGHAAGVRGHDLAGPDRDW